AVQPLHVGGAVEPGAARGARRAEEAAALVHPQVLHLHPHHRRRHRDGVDALGRVRCGGAHGLAPLQSDAIRNMYRTIQVMKSERTTRSHIHPDLSPDLLPTRHEEKEVHMLLRTDPFREFDRIVSQAFGTSTGTSTRPVALPMDAW